MTGLLASISAPITLGDRRFLHPGPLRWLRASAWMIGLSLLVGIASYGSLVAINELGPKTLWTGPIASIVGAGCSLGIYALLVRLAEGRWPDELSPRHAIGGILLGLLIGVAVFSAIMATLVGTGLYRFEMTGPASPLTAISQSIQSGVIEEVMARAIVLRLVWRASGPWVAFAVSAALFGGLHLTHPNASWFAAVCVALEAGIMLGAFYALTGRLWASIGLHAGWNFIQGYLFDALGSAAYFGPSIASSGRTSHNEWLTGGAFGPEASLPALVICTAVGLGTLVWAAKAGAFRKPVKA
jgi:membrane protease YdiL (CAAX protease family)